MEREAEGGRGDRKWMKGLLLVVCMYNTLHMEERQDGLWAKKLLLYVCT